MQFILDGNSFSKNFQYYDLKNQIPLATGFGNNHQLQILPLELNNSKNSGGQPLPTKIRKLMEAHFNACFSDVLVHIGPQPASIGALAFACGSDLYFSPGAYNPNNIAGLQLLAHELTHVLQQREGRVKNPWGSGIAVIQDAELEAEADQMSTLLLLPKSGSSFKPEHSKRKATQPRQRGTVIQCVLTFHKKLNGPTGDKDIYEQGGVYYFKRTAPRQDGNESWKVVILENERYKPIDAPDLLIAVAPVVATGWSLDQVVNAFKKGGPSPIREYPKILSFVEVHAKTDVKDGQYPSFHVKFDHGTKIEGTTAQYISAFYSYPGATFSNYGQNENDRRMVIAANTKNASGQNFLAVMAKIRTEADRIAAELKGLLK